MKSSRAYVVREFGYLLDGEERGPFPNAIGIPRSAFKSLLTNLHNDRDEDEIHSIIKPATFQRRLALKVQNYVGVLQTPCGTQIEILPKLYINDVNCTSADVARYQLLKMLKALRDSPFKDAGRANIYDAKMPLLEVYITQFLLLINQLIKRGIRSDYISTQKNSWFIKGRILIAQQLRRNTFHQERFYIEYQEYQVNRPANRLIKSALLLVAKLARSAQNQRLSREFGFVFDEVPASSDVRTDFQRLKTDRTMGYYKDVLSWCRLILRGHGPTATTGALNTLTLVYPMERIFEDYVAQCLKKKLLEYFPNADRLKTQARKHYLVSEHDGSPIFNLRPDLFVLNGKQNICVMDTKWKLLDGSDRAKKYGISQADMYQLYAYGHKYLKGAASKELLLIYPKTEAFSSPLPGFNYEDGFRLRVVPFDIDTGELVGLPEYKEIGISELN